MFVEFFQMLTALNNSTELGECSGTNKKGCLEAFIVVMTKFLKSERIIIVFQQKKSFVLNIFIHVLKRELYYPLSKFAACPQHF